MNGVEVNLKSLSKARPKVELSEEEQQENDEWINKDPKARQKRINENCKKCYYRARNSTAVLNYCDYWWITNSIRPCSPLHCREAGVFREGERKGKRWNPMKRDGWTDNRPSEQRR